MSSEVIKVQTAHLVFIGVKLIVRVGFCKSRFDFMKTIFKGFSVDLRFVDFFYSFFYNKINL